MKEFWCRCWMAYKQANPLEASEIELNVAQQDLNPELKAEQKPKKDKEETKHEQSITIL